MDTPLERKIIDRIREEGCITFEAFMDMALYDPCYGYYCSEDLSIGKAGDFYTSAHLHPVFGAMLGRQMREMWEFMGSPAFFTLVEVGGGEGHICRDMLDSLRGDAFFDALRYVIVEINPAMQKKQYALLGDLAGKVRWVSSLAEAGHVRGCIFSNELLDAFPVHLVEMQETLQEIYVAVKDGGLALQAGPPSSPLLEKYLAAASVVLERGYRTEINLRVRDWLRDVGACLDQGFLLTIDYGYTARDYYSEDRNRGTLVCYYRHQMNEDPLEHPGSQDITSHVDFSAVKRGGDEFGLRSLGLSSQGAYLVSLGIDEEIQRLAATSADYPTELARIKKLIMPQGMGDSHMVMAQYKGPGAPVLRGFALRNQLRYL